MKKLRTASHLQDALDDAFAWRLKELDDLKASVRSALPSHERTLIRSGVPLAYAHWEGFVKQASEHYLNFVSNTGLRYDELNPCFVAVGLRGYLRQIFDSSRGDVFVGAMEYILDTLPTPAKIPYGSAINTRSNLNFSIFEGIARTVGVDAKPYETRSRFIDESLLARRNRIAHGEYLDIDKAAFFDLCDEAIAMLRWYKSDLENCLALRSYLAS